LIIFRDSPPLAGRQKLRADFREQLGFFPQQELAVMRRP
jgi:hypothetical protein